MASRVKSVSASKIQMSGLDALFQTEPQAEIGGERVQEIPLTELHPFKNHPFQVRDDEAMQKTVESIAEYGVLVPGIVRPCPEGGYEIVAGHRRKRASELAGKETMPVIVRTLDDDESTLSMVDSNLQREKILPSEKAFAYKMKFYSCVANSVNCLQQKAILKEIRLLWHINAIPCYR